MPKKPNTNLRPNPAGDRPQIHSTAYIDPSAQVIGNVHIGPRVFVGPKVVLRADELDASGKVAPIIIGEDCNIQDGVIVHSLAGESVTVGQRVSLAHGCVLHGPCSIGEGSFIGFRAIVFRAAIGAGAFIGHGGIIQGVELPPESMVPPGTLVNSPDSVSKLPRTGPKEKKFMEEVIATNLNLASGYRKLSRSTPESAR